MALESKSSLTHAPLTHCYARPPLRANLMTLESKSSIAVPNGGKDSHTYYGMLEASIMHV